MGGNRDLILSLAEFERNLIIERTRAGLATARARWKKGGKGPRRSIKKKGILR